MFCSLEELAAGTEKSLFLGRLLRAGLPVPPGFILTGEAHQEFLRENSPREQLPDSVLHLLKKEYEELSVGKDLLELSGSALDIIKSVRGQASVAVRGPGLTILSVKGFPHLQKAVREVWTRAPGELLVQKMVETEKVAMISRHPVRDALLIECTWGLSLLENSTPDLAVLPAEGDATLQIGGKEWSLVKDSLSEQPILERVLSEKRAIPSLTKADAAALVRLLKQAEELLGTALSLEVAFQRNRPWVLQARPFRKLPQDGLPGPAGAPGDGPLGPAGSSGRASPDGPLGPAGSSGRAAGEPVAQGDVICPGKVWGKVRRVLSGADIATLQPGEIAVADSVQKGLLGRPLAGLIVRKGSLFQIQKSVSFPCLRADTATLLTGQDIFLDAVEGTIYRL